jgi:protein-tyrosine-phosphatase
MKVLFICRGNVARSQMAEVIFRNLAQGKHEMSSAGTIVKTKDGESCDGQKLKDCPGAEHVVTVLNELGILGGEVVRSQLTKQIIEDADEIVVMAEEYSIPDYVTQASFVTYWDIEDPKGQDLVFTRNTCEQVRDHVTAFYKTLE